MTRVSSDQAQRERDTLRSIIVAIVDFHAAREPDFRDGAAESFRATTDRVHATGSLSGLRQMRDDLVAMTDALRLAPAELNELDALLRMSARVSLDDVFARQFARITKLRERGRISTEAQYYLAKERLERIWDNPAHSDEFNDLQRIIDAYETTAAARAHADPHRDPAA